MDAQSTLPYRRLVSLESQLLSLDWLLADLPLAEGVLQRQVLTRMLSSERERDDLYFLVAEVNDAIEAVALAQFYAGHTALLWPPRRSPHSVADVRADLLAALLTELRRRQVCVAQTLLLPSAHADRQLLAAAGLQSLGELVYMTAERDVFPPRPPSANLHWSNAGDDEIVFRDLVRSTYIGSLDCPLIDGWRNLDDVLAGYRATGNYNPELWWLSRRKDTAVGCAIVADFPDAAQWELVYFGVHPDQRGRGHGEEMILWLQHQAWLRDVQRIVLAVDSANRPAIQIYSDCGFFPFDRRTALACRL